MISARGRIASVLGLWVLANGVGGSVVTPPRPEVKPSCLAQRCTLDIFDPGKRIDFREVQVRLGIEKKCGATAVGEGEVLAERVRFTVDVDGVNFENPCDVQVILGGYAFTYREALSRGNNL